jgi:CO/xanthine dehydrogenase Mo-binding subunit
MQMNKLADALGIDPVDLRLKNLLQEESLTVMGTPLPGGVSLIQVTQECAREAGWVEADDGWQRPQLGSPRHPSIRRGIGIAAAYKNIGFSFGYQENCWAKVELHGETEIEEAVVYIGSAEVGQGSHTAIQQMAAEALSVELNLVRVEASDTSTSPGSAGSVSASRMTYMAGNAVRGAGEAALDNWAAEDRPAIGEFTYLAPKTTPFDPQTGHGKPNLAYGYVAETVEVEVDTETGELRVLRVVCADDVGKAINPQLVEGQIEGAVVQALGWAAMENFATQEGQALTDRLTTYLIPTALDVPGDVTSVIVETSDPSGPWGARGVGEMPFIPLAPALVAAVHNATGIWIDELPLTPERILLSIVGSEDKE